jgi:plastocyanin
LNQQNNKDFSLSLGFKVSTRDKIELGIHIQIMALLDDAELFEESLSINPSKIDPQLLTDYFSNQKDLKKIIAQEFSGYTGSQVIEDTALIDRIAIKLRDAFVPVFSENGLQITIAKITSKPIELDDQIKEYDKLGKSTEKVKGSPTWVFFAPVGLIIIVLGIWTGVTGSFPPWDTATTVNPPTTTTRVTTSTTAPLSSSTKPVIFTVPTTPPETGNQKIRLEPGSYIPFNLYIAVGTSITFENPDDVEISLISDYPFNQKILVRNSWTFTFGKAGTYSYWIESQPGYKGTIIVV